MNFPTAYRVHERFPSEPGQREVTLYRDWETDRKSVV